MTTPVAHRFHQLDVYSAQALRGNPLAVVHDAARLSDEVMAGLAPEHYWVSQGTVLGRQGRVHVDRMGDTIWVGGEVAACVDGQVVLP